MSFPQTNLIKITVTPANRTGTASETYVTAFHGDKPETFAAWLKEFKALTINLPAPNRISTLGLAVQGTAHDILQERIVVDEDTTFDDYCNALIQIYLPTYKLEKLRISLEKVRQSDDETVEMYNRRFNQALLQWTTCNSVQTEPDVLTVTQQIRMYTLHLNPFLRQQLENHGKTTLIETQIYASEKESSSKELLAYFTKQARSQSKPNTPSSTSSNRQGQNGNAKPGKKNDGSASKSKLPQFDAKAWCENHKKHGHRTADCRFPPSKKESEGREQNQITIQKPAPPTRTCSVEPIQISIVINGQLVTGLIDTGAQLSVIEEELVKSLNLGPITPDSTTLKSYDGRSALTQGYVKINASLPSFPTQKPISMKFTVVPALPQGIILGMDLLSPLHLEISLKNHTLSLAGTTIPIPELYLVDVPPSIMVHSPIFVPIDPPPKIETSYKKVRFDPQPTNTSTNTSVLDSALPTPSVTDTPVSLPTTDLDPFDLENLLPSFAVNAISGLHKCLEAFPEIIGSETNIGQCTLPPIAIQVDPTIAPKAYRPFRTPQKHLADVKAEIRNLIELGIIEPSTSPWAFPAFTVPKKDGKPRLVVDFRQLNKVTQIPHFPLPRSEDILQDLQGSTVFSQIDLNKGYHQLLIEESSRQITSFVLPFGQYQYKRLPFGLSGAPMYFQKVMSDLFSHLPFVKIYLDDILIHSTDAALHEDHLRQVFEILSKHKLTINAEKSTLSVTKVTYLGYEISANEIRPAPRNLHLLQQLPTPTNKRGVRRVVGALNFFRSLIPNLSSRIAPITDLTKDNVEFYWTAEHKQIISSIVSELVNKAFLIQPNLSKPFQIYTDASDVGVGALILQDGLPVSCFSRKLLPSQGKYTTSEKEALAIVWTLQTYRHLIFGCEVQIFTDHSNLKFLDTTTIARLQRWKLVIDEFKPRIEYVKGDHNVWADIFSRNTVGMMCSIQLSDAAFPLDLQLIKEVQATDNECIEIRQQISNGSCKLYTLDQDIIVHTEKQVPLLPVELRTIVLTWFHENLQHPGITKTVETLQRYCYFPKLQEKITQYIHSCIACQTCKPRSQKHGHYSKVLADTVPWRTVALDILGPFTFHDSSIADKNKYCLTMIDTCTRWVELIPVPVITAPEICQAFDDNWLCRYPRPQYVVSDNGSQFKSQEFIELLQSYGIQPRFTSPYTPSSNGITERVHGFINNAIRINNNPIWSRQLPAIAFALRTLVHTSTKTSPAELVFKSKMMQLSTSIDKDVDSANIANQHQARNSHTRKNKSRTPYVPEVDDLVFISNNNPTKTQPRSSGPFAIIGVNNKHNHATIRITSTTTRTLPISRLTPYKAA